MKKLKKSELFKEVGRIETADYQDKIVEFRGLKSYSDLYYDDQVKFCFTIKKFLILSGGWEVIPSDNSEEAIEQARFVINTFNNLEHSLNTILFSMLSAIDYGYSISELIYTEQDKKIVLKNIKTKPPWRFQFEKDEYGNLVKLYCDYEEVPIEKFVIYSYMPNFSQIEGESDLKSAYSSVWAKDKLIKFWLRYLEKYGTPIAKGKIPLNASDEERQRFEQILRKIHNATSITLPQSERGEGFDIELLESKKDAGNQFLEAINKMDERIARSALIPALFGATKASYGSYALGELQFETVYKFLSTIGENFADEVINKQVIKRLIDLNYSKPFYPRFKLKPIDRTFTEAIIKTLIPEPKETNGT